LKSAFTDKYTIPSKEAVHFHNLAGLSRERAQRPATSRIGSHRIKRVKRKTRDCKSETVSIPTAGLCRKNINPIGNSMFSALDSSCRLQLVFFY